MTLETARAAPIWRCTGEGGAGGIACLSLSPPIAATESVQRLFSAQQLSEQHAAEPETAARVLRRRLEQDPLRYSGQLVSTREPAGSENPARHR